MSNLVDIDNDKLVSGKHELYYGGNTINYYIPENVNENTKVFYYVGGSGGTEKWNTYITSYLEKNEDSNAIVIGVQDTRDANMVDVRNNIDGLVSNIYSNNGIETIPSIEYSGWSAGAKVVAKAAASYYTNSNNDSTLGPKTIYAIDWGDDLRGGYNSFSVDNPKDKEVISILAENNVTLVGIEGRMSESDVISCELEYRLSALEIESSPGVYEESFYVPDEYIKISKDSDLKIVLATFDSSGREGSDHTIAPCSFAGSMIPSLCTDGNNKGFSYDESQFGTNFTYNTNADEQYEWYILEDGKAQKISFQEYLEISSGKRTTTIYQELKNDFLGTDVTFSSDYEYVDTLVNGLIGTIDSMSINDAISSSGIDNGSATFKVISGTYNNYLQNSKNLLNDSRNLCLNILNIADSVKKLDTSLAGQVYGNIGDCLDNMSLNVETCIEGFKNYVFEDNVQGKNIKMTKEDLQYAMSDNNFIINAMLQDVDDTYVLINKLEDFINGSKDVLCGSGWDEVRGKIGNYCVALRRKNEYATDMVYKFNESYKELYDYMEDFIILDTTKIPEVEKNISDLEQQIQMLNETKAALEAEHGKEVCDGYDDKGNCISSHIIDNSAKIAAVSKSISLATQLKQEYTNLLNKLNNLHKVDLVIANSISTVATAISDIFNIF